MVSVVYLKGKEKMQQWFVGGCSLVVMVGGLPWFLLGGDERRINWGQIRKENEKKNLSLWFQNYIIQLMKNIYSCFICKSNMGQVRLINFILFEMIFY